MTPAEAALRRGFTENHLEIAGRVAVTPGDGLPLPTGTLLIIDPHEPAFWPHFTASPEYSDGQANPLDRWSARVIGRLAAPQGLAVVYPSGGPPWHPFIEWALCSGRCFTAPVGFLVHADRGLFFSASAAILVPWQTTANDAPSPCPACPQPCKTACPVGALTENGYDVAACKAYVTSPKGAQCRLQGCAVRRACLVGAGLRLPEQSAFHMAAFAPNTEAPA